MKITYLHPQAHHAIGFIPSFLHEPDPRPAQDQLHESYAHGGGWQPFHGFSINHDTMEITYPEDPPLSPLAKINFRDEEIYIYPHAWVMIYRSPTDFSISRMD